jgi:8-oxo-dGTP pyrophosphatase MutT (NUDIX family)
MKSYCVGFLFDNKDNVLLVKKNRPEWQFGRLNGIGGKVEPAEFYKSAMVRESVEEIGFTPEWELFSVYKVFGEYILYIFRAFVNDITVPLTNDVGEEHFIVPVAQVKTYTESDMIYNLSWLIPLALDKDISVVDIIAKR